MSDYTQYRTAPDALRRHFPKRPLKVNRLKNERPIAIYLSALVLGIIFISFMFMHLPDLYEDYTIDQEGYLPLPSASVIGECARDLKVLIQCDVSINFQGKKIDKSFHFIDFSKQEYTVYPIHSVVDPMKVTLDIGIDKLYNRIGTLVGWLLFFAILSIGGLVGGVRLQKRTGYLLSQLDNQPLKLVYLPVKMKRKRSGAMDYFIKQEGKTVKVLFYFRKIEPIFVTVDEDPDTIYTLGISDQDKNVAMPLDSEFTRLNLSETERKELEEVLEEYIRTDIDMFYM